MTLIGREQLHQFTLQHPDALKWIEAWIAEVQNSKWRKPQDIKKRYTTASFLAKSIIIFNVKGNSYRLEVQVAYRTNKIIVKWIGTHAEYSKRYK